MRPLHADVITALGQSVLRPLFLIELDFGGGNHLRLHTRTGTLTIGGNDYLGNGWLSPIDSIDEEADIRAQGCAINILGAPSEVVVFALNEASLGDVGIISFALVDSSGDIIGAPYEIFRGYLDVPTINRSETSVTMTFTLESDLKNLQRQSEFRYTSEAQKHLFNGDLGFDYVASIENWDGYWGKLVRPTWLRRKRDKR
jgi:hypothetical protein